MNLVSGPLDVEAPSLLELGMKIICAGAIVGDVLEDCAIRTLDLFV